jgi:hypothetical protein
LILYRLPPARQSLISKDASIDCDFQYHKAFVLNTVIINTLFLFSSLPTPRVGKIPP